MRMPAPNRGVGVVEDRVRRAVRVDAVDGSGCRMPQVYRRVDRADGAGAENLVADLDSLQPGRDAAREVRADRLVELEPVGRSRLAERDVREQRRAHRMVDGEV